MAEDDAAKVVTVGRVEVADGIDAGGEDILGDERLYRFPIESKDVTNVGSSGWW